ncbi:MAG TPA: hypothetical protein PKJ33_03445 [Alphaproteobacteria bacterium]|nr:hypothetical protein [Alphaproteobacteria bacterium]
MKALGWTSDVMNVFYDIDSKSPKEKQRLKDLAENYHKLDKIFLKELKKQKDKEFVKKVLSWLDHKLFSDGWGYFPQVMKKGVFPKNDPFEKDKIEILKTIKIAFKEFNFEPQYISINGRYGKNPEYTINALSQLLEHGMLLPKKATAIKTASVILKKRTLHKTKSTTQKTR